MNDPHVVSLEYRIVHDPKHIEWSEAKDVVFAEDDFTVEIKNQRVFFRFTAHYTSEDEAQSAVRSYVQNWEFQVGLQCGPGAFNLRFVRSEMIDRNPPEGGQLVGFSGTLEIDSAINLILRPSEFPKPAATGRIKRTPDVNNMYHRYLGYRAGQEPLPSMAYFCFTVLESMAGRARKRTERRQAAAEKFSVAVDVLNRVGDLSSEAGGPAARKQVGINQPYSPDDETFLRTAIQHMIFRAAEVAHDPDTPREPITLETIRSNRI
ncbi:MAG: hypothetical protein OXE84_02640 [Rhodobacteraceae bacterium]|nr:hypothetical protein [Paracoccaceae bacterium]MCY4198071.1 hypothetical protein [Paracoccaceae bacterium]